MTNLGQFLNLLRREEEIVDVEAPVSSDLEIAEIHRRVIAAGGPALLFRNVEGADFPCVTNLFGTPRRVELAFGPRPGRFLRELVSLAQDLPDLSPGRLWSRRGLAREALRVGLKSVRSAPVAERRQAEPDLTRLPLLKTWPEDGGHFVTLPLVYTEHPGTGHHNLGMYRMQRYDERTLGVHWQIQKGGGFHYHAAEGEGRPLPLTLLVGGPPALILAAIGPLPENVPELVLASLLQGGKVRRTARRRPPAPAPGRGGVRRAGTRPAPRAAAGGPLRRPLRLLLAAPRLPRPAGGAPLPPPRRRLPRHRGGQAAPGGPVARQLHPGADDAADPPRHALHPLRLELRRDRLPLPDLDRGGGTLQARGR